MKMHDKMLIGRLYPSPVMPAPNSVKPSRSSNVETSFEQVLSKEMLSFSGHAKTRLAERGIRLTSSDLSNIQSAVDKAAAKGAKDSLIMLNNVALIVNVPNKTVVTAMDKAGMNDHVFTNIDSAVFI